MLRPLFLDFGDDPTTHAVDDQYLFGRNLLVAPILDEGGESRRVYLPRGRWVDYWSKEALEGGRWIEARAPLDTLPLYVRAGAVLPHGPAMQHVDELPMDPLTLEVYASETEGSYTIHDEGRPDIPISYRREGDALTVEVGAAPGRGELVVYGAEVSGAESDGEPLEVTPTDRGASIGFDATEPRTMTLRLAGGG
jgi:alpha-glucosidase (family GH31 glycosyl hydrolase)